MTPALSARARTLSFGEAVIRIVGMLLGRADTWRCRSRPLIAPDVIVATGTAGMRPLLQVTRTVPIVFNNVADPVGAGFVSSMARPGGNATGFIQFEYTLSGKWLELLKQIAPRLTRVAVLGDPEITSGIGQFAVIQSVAPGVGVDVSAITVRDAARSNAPSGNSHSPRMAA
jgi:ABC-type uncharacterized transport system substrate-binding protein